MSTEKNAKTNLLANAIKDTTWLQDAQWRQFNADWLDLSTAIALKILRFLRTHKMTQKELADQLGFSPQYINKIVKGSENLTLETICKIQKGTGLKLIEVSEVNSKTSYFSSNQFINLQEVNFNNQVFSNKNHLHNNQVAEISNQNFASPYKTAA